MKNPYKKKDTSKKIFRKLSNLNLSNLSVKKFYDL